MQITYIAAGAAGTFCGACTRDAALFSGLISLGQNIQVVPLYTPLKTDQELPKMTPIYYGGINAWLQQVLFPFRYLPSWMDRWLDSAGLLKKIERFAVNTRPENLGPMTVSVLKGEHGKQKKELHKLIKFLLSGEKPDLINLSNTLLLGLAPALKEALGVPIYCTLQGEETFVKQLGKPYSAQAQEQMQKHAQSVIRFIAPNQAYLNSSAKYLNIQEDKITLVRPGLDMCYFNKQITPKTQPFSIGFLGRICKDKGLDILVSAFLALKKKFPDLKLLVSGQVFGIETAFFEEEKQRIASRGFLNDFEFRETPDMKSKIAFFESCSVFCAPSRIAEQRGMSALEALALGLPCVLPRQDGFMEIAELTSGVILTTENTETALVETLTKLIENPGELKVLGQKGFDGVREFYTAAKMAEETLKLYQEF